MTIVLKTEQFNLAKDAITDQLFELTKRQKEVLECLVKGHSNKMIAREIGVCHQTVKAHVSEIIRRLNVKNRTEAALIAVIINGCVRQPKIEDIVLLCHL